MNFTMLQHSVFLQALGSAILNSLWQGFICWAVYDIIVVSYKSASSAFKNRLSTVFIFVSFFWFFVTLLSHLLSPADLSPIIASAHSNQQISGSHSLEQVLAFAVKTVPYLSVAYIILLFVLMIKLISSIRHVYFISKNGLSFPPQQLQQFASKVANQINITRKLSLWVSHHIDVPATIGFIKPVILIPIASINSLSNEQLEAIILHELSHIKRNDYRLNLLLSIIDTVLFFNPFILLLSKVVKRERENCCDDFVMQYQYDPHSYASALLRLEQGRKSKNQLAIGAVSGKKQLLTRIVRITGGRDSQNQFNYGQKLITLLFLTGIICSIAWLSPANNGKVLVKQVAKNEVTSRSIIKSSPLKGQPFNFRYTADSSWKTAIEDNAAPQIIATPALPTIPTESSADLPTFDNSESGDNFEALQNQHAGATQNIFDDQSLLKLIPLKTLQ